MKLIHYLWEDRDEAQGRSSLRQLLWSVRKLLGSDSDAVIASDGDSITLSKDATDIDTNRFETLAASGLQEDLEHLKSAIQYCNELGQSELDPEFVQQIVENKSYLKQVFDQLAWRNLPDYMKWGVEAMVIAVSVSIFSII